MHIFYCKQRPNIEYDKNHCSKCGKQIYRFPDSRVAYNEAKKIIEYMKTNPGVDYTLHGLGFTRIPPELFEQPPEFWFDRRYNLNDPRHRVDLSGNKLKSLPVEIGELSFLKLLRIQDNLLEELPNEIGGLENLVILHLSGNRLKRLPGSIGQLTNLTTLNLDNNKLETLPPAIGNLKNLKHLHLKRNKLTDLPVELKELTSLEAIHLRGNRLSTLPGWAKELPVRMDEF